MELYFAILGFVVKWFCLAFVALGIPGFAMVFFVGIIYLIMEDNASDKTYSIIAAIIFMFFLPLGLYASGNLKSKMEEASVERVEVTDSKEIRRFTLVSYRPPKHMYVTLKDVGDNRVFENQYVAKHCSINADAIGKEYNIHVEFFHYSDKPDQGFVRFSNLSGVFCG